MITATTRIVHDKRIETKEHTYAVKLRVTYDRIQKYYPLGLHLTVEDWEKTQQPNPRKENKANQIFFNKIEQRAIDVIREIEVFTFELFEKKFDQQAAPKKEVFFLIQEYIDKLKSEERLNTAETYKSALKSFTTFLKSSKKTKLLLTSITPDWLYQYEKFMSENGSSATTIGIYLRNLRTIINIAIEDGNLDRSLYPFGKRKYQIPSGKNVKKALKLADIKRIFEYQTNTKAENKAKDLWLFSYLCNGANVKDIVKLQYKNISSKNITFIRSKTERSTKSNQKPITIVLMPEIEAIIKKWGIIQKSPEDFVFGVLSENDTAQNQLAKIKQITKTINKYMKAIGKKLELELKLTTYTARHSFATVLKRSGAPIEFISESLGHKDLGTTENYLDSFENEIKEQYQRKLLNF
jgi:site-specific recombinase XerD